MQFPRIVELVHRVRSKVDRPFARPTKSGDDRLGETRDSQFHPLHQRRGFAEQVLAILFLPRHAATLTEYLYGHCAGHPYAGYDLSRSNFRFREACASECGYCGRVERWR